MSSMVAEQAPKKGLPAGIDPVSFARAGGIASGEARRLRSSVRIVAEEGFALAITAMRDEIARLLGNRARSLAAGGDGFGRGKTVQERRLWALCFELAKHTKHVLPISVQGEILHRAEIPSFPADVLAQLQSLGVSPPNREALAALEADNIVDAEIVGDAPSHNAQTTQQASAGDATSAE